MIKKNNPFNSDKKISKKYLLKNGSIIDVIKNKIIKEDLYIKNKVVEKIGKNLSKIVDEDTEIIDCKNLYISPGLIDMRFNISEPGHEHKETIKSEHNETVNVPAEFEISELISSTDQFGLFATGIVKRSFNFAGVLVLNFFWTSNTSI